MTVDELAKLAEIRAAFGARLLEASRTLALVALPGFLPDPASVSEDELADVLATVALLDETDRMAQTMMTTAKHELVETGKKP